MPSSVFKRIVAIFLDTSICTLASIILFLPISKMMFYLGVYDWIPLFIITGCYFVIFETKYALHQTIGRRLLGIELRNIDGSKIPVAKSIGRYLLYSLPFMNRQISNLIANTIGITNTKHGGIVYLVIVGIVFVGITAFLLFRKDKRGIHDILFGTMVVKKETDAIKVSPTFTIPSTIASVIMFGILLWLFGGVLEGVSEKEPFSDLEDISKRISKNSPYDIINTQYHSFKNMSSEDEILTLHVSVIMTQDYYHEETRKTLYNTLFALMEKENMNNQVDNLKITVIIRKYYGAMPFNKYFSNVKRISTSK